MMITAQVLLVVLAGLFGLPFAESTSTADEVTLRPLPVSDNYQRLPSMSSGARQLALWRMARQQRPPSSTNSPTLTASSPATPRGRTRTTLAALFGKPEDLVADWSPYADRPPSQPARSSPVQRPLHAASPSYQLDSPIHRAIPAREAAAKSPLSGVAKTDRNENRVKHAGSSSSPSDQQQSLRFPTFRSFMKVLAPIPPVQTGQRQHAGTHVRGPPICSDVAIGAPETATRSKLSPSASQLVVSVGCKRPSRWGWRKLVPYFLRKSMSTGSTSQRRKNASASSSEALQRSGTAKW